MTLGYLEPMFAGVSTELLWKPVNARYALGVEVNRVKQRELNQRFGLQDYEVTTGHVSAYYDIGNGFQTRVDAGQYLAGDVGAALTVAREFHNGWRIGVFATKTDVSSEDFGEGSFDKGIEVKVPLHWLTGKPTGNAFTTVLRPVQRDGGARLDVAGRLYEKVRPLQGAELTDSRGEVLAMTRFALLLALGLSACSSLPDWVPLQSQAAKPVLSRTTLERAGMPVIPATVESRDALATMIPSGQNGEVTSWRTGDDVTLSFNRGVLVATRGLGFDLMAADPQGTLRGFAGQTAQYSQVRRTLDGENRDVFETLSCTISAPVSDPISILCKAHATLRHIETCRGNGEPIINQNWRGADGQVWKSRVRVSEGAGFIVTEVVVR